MFTGIIEATAKVLMKTGNGLVLERPVIFDDIKIGSSIAVSGVCLTVTKFDQISMSFDVIETTLSKTKFGSLKIGDSVNVERAMKADGRFEGHSVQGHCEGVGEIGLGKGGGVGAEGTTLFVKIPHPLRKFVVPHGSITIDGVALTVAALSDDHVIVALIPHTRASTTLGSLKAGDAVNVETDILAKYILAAHDKQ